MSALLDPTAMLDRQVEFLRPLPPASFLAHLPSYVRTLRLDPVVSSLLDDLNQEVVAALTSFSGEEARAVRELQTIRKRAVTVDASIDDSTLTADPNKGHDFEFEGSLAKFDVIAGLSPNITLASPTGDTLELATRVPPMHRILREKVRKIPATASDRDDMFAELEQVKAHHDYASRELVLTAATHPGASAWRIESFAADLNPPPGATYQERIEWYMRTHLRPVQRAIFGGGDALDQHERGEVERTATALRGDVDRLNIELVRRLHTRRSLRAVIARFKLRCESYDRARLRGLADTKGRREAPLTLEAARFLFDSGLTPYIDPTIGGFRPDILDARATWTFYLETKQYGNASEARKNIASGARQVWDTAGVLKSLDLTEAFLLIFRRGGPRCVLPDELRAEGLVVFPMLIDIADTTESGSKQAEQPLDIAAADLLPTPAAGG